MSTRNRGNVTRTSNSSNATRSAGRRAGGSTARQAVAILFMGALSFVLGFVVLSRFMPTERGPDTPIGPPATGGHDGETHTEQRAAPPPSSNARRVASAPRSAAPAANTPGPSIDPAPSIDPVDEGETQKPASIDESSDDRKDRQKSAEAEKLAANVGKDDVSQTDSARSATDGATQPDTPTPRRRRRHRAARAASAEVTTPGQPDGKSPDDTATQRARSVDDTGGNN